MEFSAIAVAERLHLHAEMVMRYIVGILASVLLPPIQPPHHCDVGNIDSGLCSRGERRLVHLPLANPLFTVTPYFRVPSLITLCIPSSHMTSVTLLDTSVPEGRKLPTRVSKACDICRRNKSRVSFASPWS